MSAPTSGLARLTIRAPRRSLDLAIPHHVPLAELLPEVLYGSGEASSRQHLAPAGGWMLRRGDGTSLRGDLALAAQGVRDGDVLYLVPRHLTWPEPAYDDVVEEIGVAARAHGRGWDPAATRTFALAAAGLVLLTGLGTLLATPPPRTLPAVAATAVAALLLAAGALLSRALGDGVAGAAAAGMALPYATAAGLLLVPGSGPNQAGAGGLILGASALLFTSALGAVAVGYGLRVFTTGGAVGVAGLVAGALGITMPAPRVAAVLVVLLVAGVGAAPLLAVRSGRLPLPVVTASPQAAIAQRRPTRPEVIAAVVRADEILIGSLTGIGLAAAACVAVLVAAGGVAAPLLGGLAAAVLLLRARLFPAVASRLPLLCSGLAGVAATAVTATAAAASATRLLTAALAVGAVVALLTTAAMAVRRRGGSSPYLRRLADVLDVATVVALAPVACAVLDLFGWVRGLSG